MPADSRPVSLHLLVDVWLRPRRVFRALAQVPVGRADYALAATQGMVSWLALCRAQSLGLHSSVTEILTTAVLAGPIAGILGIMLMCAIYRQIGRRAGGAASNAQIFHVLAYGGTPLVVLLGVWVGAALILGPATFVKQPPPNPDWLAGLVRPLLSVAHWALIGWSPLLQIMGFSEVQGLLVRRAFGIWIMGQLLVLLAMMILAAMLYGPAGVPPG
jgi:Yip1 domain